LGDGIDPVIYYFDYSIDGITTDQIIHDRTNNTDDTIPLLNPDPYYTFLGNPPTRDDLATTLVDGSSRLGEVGGAPGTPFQFSTGAEFPFLLPGSRMFNVETTGHGGITVTKNVLGHQNISDAGGFTFESYVKRTGTAGMGVQQIWSPEGSHSLEISSAGNLQLLIRGLTAPISVPVSTALPLNEWHHVMAVLDVIQPLPPGGDPDEDSLVANYSLYIDGQLVGTTPNADLIQGTCCIIEFFDREHGIGGSELSAVGQYFRGQMALTRLSLGALSVEQSLYFTGNDGDYNRDGAIDAADYVMWRKLSGSAAMQGALADGTGDGLINEDDYYHWTNRFGALPPGGSGNSLYANVVPEPAAVLLISVVCVLLPYLFMDRRQNSTAAVPEASIFLFGFLVCAVLGLIAGVRRLAQK
jgi:hypothetical protein